MNLTPREKQLNRPLWADMAMRGELDGWLHDHTEAEGECLIWQGGFSNSGRTPVMSLPRMLPAPPMRQSAITGARRVIWEQATGKQVRPGQMMVTICGDLRCVRPDHMKPMVMVEAKALHSKQGRLKLSQAVCARRSIIHRRISEQQRQEIRARAAAVESQRGNFTKGGVYGRKALYQELGVEYGVHWQTIGRIVNEASLGSLGMFSQLLAANQPNMKRAA